MSRQQTIGIVVLIVFLILIVVIMRSCRSDHIDPVREDPPSGQVSYTSAAPLISVAG